MHGERSYRPRPDGQASIKKYNHQITKITKKKINNLGFKMQKVLFLTAQQLLPA